MIFIYQPNIIDNCNNNDIRLWYVLAYILFSSHVHCAGYSHYSHIIIISLRFILETQIVELLLEGVLLAAAHARACLPLVLISSRELLRWHLVGELWKHGWEVSTHMLAWMACTVWR